MTLDEFLIEQRWFGSKAREVAHCDVLEDVQLTESLRATFVETVFSPGTHETYQLLRGADEAEDVLVERADVLLELIRANADVDHPARPVEQRRGRPHLRLHVDDLVAVDRVHDDREIQALRVAAGKPGVAVGRPLHRGAHAVAVTEVDVVAHADLVAVVEDG